MVLQNPLGSSRKTRSTQEMSVLCQVSFLLNVTIYYLKLTVFPIWNSFFPPLKKQCQYLISVPLAVVQMTYEVSLLLAKYH